MRRTILVALAAVLVITLVSFTKQASKEPARHFVSADGQFDFDLLNDSVDDLSLFPAEFWTGDGNELAPICIHNQELLLKYEGSSPQAKQFADFYNVLAIFHNMTSDYETAERFGEEQPEIYSEMASYIASADYTYIQDPDLQAAVKQLQDAMFYYCNHLPEEYSDALDSLAEDLFGRITPTITSVMEGVTNRYFDIIGRTDYYADFDSIINLRGRSDKDYQLQLLTAMDNASTTMERHMYAIEYAHSDVNHAYFILGAAVLNREFERGEYSPYLSEMWRTWRASMTSMIGHSSWSYIPNHLYNAKRKQVAEIILHQIETHPTDSMAQGLLIDLIGCGNIQRSGYMFGNGSVIEQMNMYPEWNN